MLIERLTKEEFDKFAKLIYQESGIFLKEAKITLLSNRLRKRLNSLDLPAFIDYYNYIDKLPKGSADRKKEIEALIDVVSTNETYFFRNERHFKAFQNECLPSIAKNKSKKVLRIWSAGCSTGEEPYTIAICVKECQKLFPGWKIEIIATDIANSVLDFAKIGKYSGRRIEKVAPELLKKYFTPDFQDPDVYSVNKELRDLIKFYPLNLFQDKFPEDVDILFCRNVMIYFDKEHQKELIGNFRKSISDDGFFFIGHSETLHSISDDFVYRKIEDAPVYIPKVK